VPPNQLIMLTSVTTSVPRPSRRYGALVQEP
jgi:hypothetical protein